MMDVDFEPVFNIVVTLEDIVEYYKERNIDFPKMKNGSPNMSRRMNKDTYELMVKTRNSELTAQYSDLIKQKQDEKKKEACLYRASTAPSNTCPICYDDMIGFSVLECTHTFCIKCTISHFRVNHTCPLCRAETCEKTKIKELIPIETIASIIDENLANVIPTRLNQDVYNYVFSTLDFVAHTNTPDVHLYTGLMYEEIRNVLFDASIGIRTWYEN